MGKVAISELFAVSIFRKLKWIDLGYDFISTLPVCNGGPLKISTGEGLPSLNIRYELTMNE